MFIHRINNISKSFQNFKLICKFDWLMLTTNRNPSQWGRVITSCLPSKQLQSGDSVTLTYDTVNKPKFRPLVMLSWLGLFWKNHCVVSYTVVRLKLFWRKALWLSLLVTVTRRYYTDKSLWPHPKKYSIKPELFNMNLTAKVNQRWIVTAVKKNLSVSEIYDREHYKHSFFYFFTIHRHW